MTAACAGNGQAIRDRLRAQPAIEPQLQRLLPSLSDAGMALNNLERLAATGALTERLPAMLAGDARRFQDLLQLLSTSQFLADTLIADPESLDAVLAPVGRHATTAELTARLDALVHSAADDAAVLHTFRRFRRRWTLRAGVMDILRDRPLEEITRDLSRCADASVEVAVRHAMRTLTRTFGRPMADGNNARLAVLAFGKLGGDELNYSSDLDLIFVYDAEGTTAGSRITSNADFFARTAAEVVRLLSKHTEHGIAYRVDLRLRPEGRLGPLARSLASTLSYYDVMGRTWERQALIKLRPVAGDMDLGNEVLRAVEPFVYRKYFSFSEIREVKALKRQMEARAARRGGDGDVKTGRGGIRDIEFTVQFLQLLNGGTLPAVRQRNTLLALETLEIAGCLTGREAYVLADAYRFLRKTEHRLQLLFDLQTHALPASDAERHRLARRMGYSDLAPFEDSRRAKGDQVRTILEHLLHQSFTGDAERVEPESDLILDPEPDEATICEVLGRHRIRDAVRAYRNLTQLAKESVRFLSHGRCRHFLASIAPPLLSAIAETPDPDATLSTLEAVTASLGAKAVLYEAFSANPPSLKLYVDLCAGSPYLCGLLISNPGMIDELLDTLVLDQPRPRTELAGELMALLHGAMDPEPILHSFQDRELLRIGARDLLGKSSVRETTAALSDLAEVILNAVLQSHASALGLSSAGFAVVALGKLGGRELNYHSDLDLLAVGRDDDPAFTELMQRTIRTLAQSGPMGKLYSVDMRLRPFGSSGNLVVTLAEFQRYFATDGPARLWERQALCRARVILGDAGFAEDVRRTVLQSVTATDWQPESADAIRDMRNQLESASGRDDLKRSAGGLVDVEFLVQLLQIKYGGTHPAIVTPNVLDALEAIRAAGLLAADEAQSLAVHYTFLRAVETRLRIVSDYPLSDIPAQPAEREKLARRLGLVSGERFQNQYARATTEVRALFDDVTRRERGP